VFYFFIFFVLLFFYFFIFLFFYFLCFFLFFVLSILLFPVKHLIWSLNKHVICLIDHLFNNESSQQINKQFNIWCVQMASVVRSILSKRMKSLNNPLLRGSILLILLIIMLVVFIQEKTWIKNTSSNKYSL